MSRGRRQPTVRVYQPAIRFHFQVRHLLWAFGSGFLLGLLVMVAVMSNA